MSVPPPTYYRSRREEQRRRRRRRRRITLLVVVVVLVVAALAVAGVWSGRLHLPSAGPAGSSASGSAGSSASGPAGQPSAPESSGGDLTIVGLDRLWNNGPVDLRFHDADGKPVEASYSIDGSEWVQGKRAHVRCPADHANDGMHAVQAKPVDGGDAATIKVGIDTTPPEVTGVKVSPDRTDGSGTLELSFTAAAEESVTVQWSVVDVLDEPVGEQGEAGKPAGAVAVDWSVPTIDGEKLGPGTYWLSVKATDQAGNVTDARASLACVRPVKARVITDLPKAGKEVALTFDGGSGYAWRSQMNELYSHDQLGTFFCTGVSVDRYPDMAKLAVEQRQTIGNHSYDHPDFGTISYQEQYDQLARNSDAWWKACKAIPQPFFRPPYGSQTATTVKAAGDAGYRYVVMWNGDAGDWRNLPASQVAANALAAVKPGAIIVFHTQWNSDAALPAILKGLKAKGYKAVSLAQLCADAGLPY